MERQIVNCTTCGRFIGSDGYVDIYDHELGYSLCKQCLDLKKGDNKI